jgi:hypothetical protein
LYALTKAACSGIATPDCGHGIACFGNEILTSVMNAAVSRSTKDDDDDDDLTHASIIYSINATRKRRHG